MLSDCRTDSVAAHLCVRKLSQQLCFYIASPRWLWHPSSNLHCCWVVSAAASSGIIHKLIARWLRAECKLPHHYMYMYSNVDEVHAVGRLGFGNVAAQSCLRFLTCTAHCADLVGTPSSKLAEQASEASDALRTLSSGQRVGPQWDCAVATDCGRSAPAVGCSARPKAPRQEELKLGAALRRLQDIHVA